MLGVLLARYISNVACIEMRITERELMRVDSFLGNVLRDMERITLTYHHGKTETSLISTVLSADM